MANGKVQELAAPEISEKKRNDLLINSLGGLCDGLGFDTRFGQQLSQTTTLMLNNRGYFLSNDWNTLSYMYTTHGVVQTLIDQPIEDAFRGGVEIKSSQLDQNDIQDLQNWMKENGDWEEIKDAAKWTRLYGGGGLVINVGLGQPQGRFNPENINKNTPLSFYAADLWELNFMTTNTYGDDKPYLPNNTIETPFNFYGQLLNKTRVLRFDGKRAPSFCRPQLRYWGMSECERLVRSLNQYIKNQDVVFELLDEAKVDVWKIQNFNTSMMSNGGTNGVTERIQLGNRLKNFQNAIVMDTDDEYEQKTMTFTGLAEMLEQIRKGIACDMKMPVDKIFGQSAAGFGSGEDSLENYNSMVEGEIRGKFDGQIMQVIKLRCQQLFGFMPDDIQIAFRPLRMLNAEQQENVKDKQFSRVMTLYDKNLISAKETIKTVNVLNLCGAEFDESGLDDALVEDNVEAEEPIEQNAKQK